MSPYRNARSSSTASKETLAIFPTTSLTSPSLSKYDLDNIHNDIKAMTEKHHYDTKNMNERISDMIKQLTNTSYKTDKQEEQFMYISSKLSTYAYCLKKMSIKETHIHPL